MRAAVLERPRRFNVVDLAPPDPGPEEVRVRLQGCGVCASNLQPYEGRDWFAYPMRPGALGHEGWGVVDAIGSAVCTIAVGERVAILSHAAYATHDLTTPDRVAKLPPQLDAMAVPGEPLACALNVFTPEDKQPELASIYALTKYDQERMCLMLGAAYDVPTVALRFFNCCGPRQALSNPYTGVLAIFASRLLNRRPPLVFEDGRQMRDFVSVHDVARACRIAYERDDVQDAVFNVGSGRPRTVLDVARAMSEALGIDIDPQVVGEYRVGDIRHCFADVGRAQQELGYEAEVDFGDGLLELAQWLEGQSQDDRVDQMRRELDDRGLVVGGRP